jgi:hypothetical protein
VLKIVSDSHLDHGLTKQHIAWIKKKFANKTKFFIQTVKLPSYLKPLKSGLYGPKAGDRKITEDMVYYKQRGTRNGESRMISAPSRLTRLMTVIAGPYKGDECVLYTAYGGPPAPPEPFDVQAKADSEKFWASHALADR